jgi:hypothetical protein
VRQTATADHGYGLNPSLAPPAATPFAARGGRVRQPAAKPLKEVYRDRFASYFYMQHENNAMSSDDED